MRFLLSLFWMHQGAMVGYRYEHTKLGYIRCLTCMVLEQHIFWYMMSRTPSLKASYGFSSWCKRKVKCQSHTITYVALPSLIKVQVILTVRVADTTLTERGVSPNFTSRGADEMAANFRRSIEATARSFLWPRDS